MDVREKLVELIESARYWGSNTSEEIADHLISNGVTVQEWISVDDRPPEEKANCIVYYKHAFCDDENHIGICVCFYDGDEFQMDFAHKVTHWMPLPQPPKGDNMQ